MADQVRASHILLMYAGSMRSTATRSKEEAKTQIEAIQADTESAVRAIQQIGEIIHQINELQTATASAVEQQTATTNEITRSISDAAGGSSEIARNIVRVAQAAQSTQGGAGETERAATDLARMAADLQQVVSQFRF